MVNGKSFQSVKEDRETIQWQGQFLGLASPGLYRVQLFEWITGSESEQRLVPATDMRYWKVYDTEEQLRDSYERYAKRQNQIEAREEREKRALASAAADSADIVIQGGRIIKQRDNDLIVVVDGVLVSGVKS